MVAWSQVVLLSCYRVVLLSWCRVFVLLYYRVIMLSLSRNNATVLSSCRVVLPWYNIFMFSCYDAIVLLRHLVIVSLGCVIALSWYCAIVQSCVMMPSLYQHQLSSCGTIVPSCSHVIVLSCYFAVVLDTFETRG